MAVPSAGDEILEGRLLRRVPPDAACFPNGVGTQPSNSAYRVKPEDDGISAFLEELASPAEALAGHPGFALIAMTVEFVRSLGFRIVYDPPPPGHVLIRGNFTKSKRRDLSLNSVVVAAGDREQWLRAAEGTDA